MFARLPPSSSELAERKSMFSHLLLQIGGANSAESAYFVVTRRRKACLHAPPQHSSPLGLVLASLARLLRHGGARFPDGYPCDQRPNLDHVRT
jgi:hypothetical protein